MSSKYQQGEAGHGPASPHLTFFVRPQDNLIIVANLAAKHEHPGGVMTQVYITYDAIGCRHGADRSQVGPMAIAQFEVNSYPQVDEMEARRIHPELFTYLADKYGYARPANPEKLDADLEKLDAELASLDKEVEEMLAASPRRRGRPAGASEPTKKKDFRFPARLLEALKAVADEQETSDTHIIVELLKRDERIQRKLEEREAVK